MKGFNVKRLAAIATGAALLGSAIAPVVSATNVTKSDIYGADGSPIVNIVVGSKAAVSDAIWAGNLAAKIAEKAVTTKSVETKLTGEGGEEVGAEPDLSDLTVDVTIGGKVVIGNDTSKRYNVDLSSRAGDKEVLSAISSGLLTGTNDSNALTSSTLPHLFNDTLREKVNNGDQSNVTSNLQVQEKIGVDVDAAFNTDLDIKDLVAQISSGGFTYIMTVGSSSTGLDLGSTSFTDGSDDHVQLVLFGEKYELSEANLGSSKYLKLVKSSAKESYNEGDTIEGLVGDNEYEGQDVTVKLVQIVQTGAASTSYQATFELYDSEGKRIDTQTVTQGENLRDVFKDSQGDEALASNLYVDTIAVGSTSGTGYVEVTKGTDTLEIYDGKVFPYDSTHTGSNPYVAQITTASGDSNSLYSIRIYNSAEVWEDPDTGNYDLGPLYPTNPGQSLTGKEGKKAVFGESWDDGTLGKGYATVEFMGFEGKEEKTPVIIGSSVTDLPAGSTGGIEFRDSDDTLRHIPFYIKVADSNSATFEFEGKTFTVFFTGANNTANDVNVLVSSGDFVNGRQWTIVNNGDNNGTIEVDGVRSASDGNVTVGSTITVDGVTYTITDPDYASGTMGVTVDVAVDIFYGSVSDSISSKNSATAVYNTTSSGSYQNTDTYGRLFLSNNSTFDGNNASSGLTSNSTSEPVTVGLYGADSSKRIFYAAQYNTRDLWLLLDAQRLGAGTNKAIQNGHVVQFLGTTVPDNDGTYTEDPGISIGSGASDYNLSNGASIRKKSTGGWEYAHYVPQTTDFNTATLYSASDAYFVAEFRVDTAVDSSDFNAYIKTKDGEPVGPYPIDNLSGYTAGSVRYLGSPSFDLKGGSDDSYFHAGYTDAGTRVELVDNSAIKFTIPQNREKVDIYVYGTSVERDVEGETVSGLKLNETGETSSGTRVTITGINGGSCVVSGGDAENAVCTAVPSSYTSPASVKNPLVYLDTEAPSGTNIIIGGHIVNKLASSLADRLTAPGDMVAEVGPSGDIYLAGYTAEDTGKAVQELINDIDSWELA